MVEKSKILHRIHEALMSFVTWRERHIKEKNFVLLLAFFVGIFCGLAALVLKFLIHTISGALTSHVNPQAGN